MLDELTTQLLSCGGVLSQIVTQMLEYQASGRPAPGTAPVPTVAHELIRSVVADVVPRYSEEDIETTATMIKDITEEICENVFFVPRSLN